MTSDGNRPRVLLVDDNTAILDRTASVLSVDCVIVGQVTDGRSVLEAVHRLQPDVVVLDISLPDMSGLDVAGHLRRAGSSVAIVFLTVHEGDEFVRAAQIAGGLGYVMKPRLASDLTAAVLEAHAGRPYTSQML